MGGIKTNKHKKASLLNVTLKKDLPKALELHRSGNLEAAESLYRRLFRKYPDDVDLLHFYGLCRFQQHNVAQAIPMLRKSIRLNPDYAAAINNLGNMLKEQGELPEAEALYRRALELEPKLHDAMVNLGVLARKRQALAEAGEWYRKAIATNPAILSAYTNLCNLLEGQKQFDKALGILDKALGTAVISDDEFEQLQYRQARLFNLEGRIAEAIKVYQNWLAKFPDNETAKYLLAAHTGEDVPAQSNSSYVKKHFDDFSDSFDEILNSLSYQAPELIREITPKYIDTNAQALATLDAGCGTGLCGEYLRDWSKTLVGIDLSGGMLALAEKTDCYDSLLEVEIVEYLEGCATDYHLVVSADTVCYFGALETLFTSVKSVLTTDGRFIFTVEAIPAPEEKAETADYVLNTHGRYSHNRQYLEAQLDAAGLKTLEISSVKLRMERGEPVMGYLVVAAR